MSDNILTKNRSNADLDIAAKDIGGVQYPRNLLCDTNGDDLIGPRPGALSLSVVESTPSTVTIVSLTTDATGSTYTAFSSQACECLDIVNTQPAAVDLEVRRGGSGNTIIVPAGSSRMFVGLSNASGLQVRRLDQSNTQVTFTGEAIAA